MRFSVNVCKKRMTAGLLCLILLCSFILYGCTPQGNQPSVESTSETVLRTSPESTSEAVSETLPEAVSGSVSQTQPEGTTAAPESVDTQASGQTQRQQEYEYKTQELYARRDGNRIYGVIYIPQDAGEKMPAVIFSHGFGGTHSVGTQYAQALARK